jgi:hypothetical protein
MAVDLRRLLHREENNPVAAKTLHGMKMADFMSRVAGRTNRSALLVTLLVVAGISAGAAGIPSLPPPDELRSTISEILSSPGYEVNPPLSWRVQQWVIEQLERLAGAISRAAANSPLAGMPEWVAPVIIGACVVALGLIVYHLLYTVRMLMVEPRRHARDGVISAAPPRSPEQVMREAEKAAAAGQLQAALRKLYEAVLLRLDRLGALRHDPARTNWENLSAATASLPLLREPMTGLAVAVDDCVYGSLPATSATYEQCRELARAVWFVEASSDE